ncbi:hypothetical protein A5652_17165, partial [Mycobacterium sp. 1165178.9]
DLEVVGEAPGVGPVGKRVDGGRQLITGDVDVLLDGFGVPVRHCVLQVAHYPAPTPARTTLDQLAATVDSLADRANPRRLADDLKVRVIGFVQQPMVLASLAGVGVLVVVVAVRRVRNR